MEHVHGPTCITATLCLNQWLNLLSLKSQEKQLFFAGNSSQSVISLTRDQDLSSITPLSAFPEFLAQKSVDSGRLARISTILNSSTDWGSGQSRPDPIYSESTYTLSHNYTRPKKRPKVPIHLLQTDVWQGHFEGNCCRLDSDHNYRKLPV